MMEERGISGISALLRGGKQNSKVPGPSTDSLQSMKGEAEDKVIATLSTHSSTSAPGGYNGKRRSTNGHMGTLSTTSFIQGVMHQQAADKYQKMSTRYTSRKQLQERDKVQLPRWVVHPHDIIAQCWWTFILCTVVITLFVEPYSLAFAAYPGLHPLNSPDTILAIIFTTVYGSDVLLNFFVAYYENGELITDLRSIAAHYARWRLWVDLLTTIPFDWIVLEAMGLQESNSRTAWFVSLLRLLRLGRAYRLWNWVQFLTFNQTLSLLAVTLIRNFSICFFVVHWAACFFYYIAKQDNFDNTTWIAQAGSTVQFSTASSIEKYIFSMYWSVITFATVGYGDLHAYSTAEAVFVIVYVFINIGIAAYIVGTITLLVVKQDTKTGQYRDDLTALDAYSMTHNIPRSLKSAMKGHLALHFSSMDSSDEVVLTKYPTNIRRRILRHLYNTPLQSCWLFRNVKQKFLDAVLAAAKVELYLPKVDIISEGDHVNELFLIVAGHALGERGSSVATTGCSEGLMLHSDGNTSVHGGQLLALGPGDPVGEMAFFTETPCLESVRTQSMCRVLVIPRTVMSSIMGDFPISARTIMDNLLDRAEQMVQREFPGPRANRVFEDLDQMPSLGLRFASPELSDLPVNDNSSNPNSGGGHLPLSPASTGGTLPSLPSDETWTGAGHDVGPGLGPSPGTGAVPRSSSGPGSKLPIPQLPSSRGPGMPGLSPALGTRSMPLGRSSFGLLGTKKSSSGMQALNVLNNLQQLRMSQQQVLANLLRVRELVAQNRARLDQQRVNEFLNACCEGNCHRIKMMLQQGCDINCSDYDSRTGLMLAAFKGANDAVKQLLAAGAFVNLQDRLGSSALLEAVKAGHDDTIELLLKKNAVLMITPVMAAAHLCTAVFEGDLPLLRRLLRAGANPNVGDYDKRTALHIAAADGNLPAVKVLVDFGKASLTTTDRWGKTPLDEARRVGAAPVVIYLQRRMPEDAVADSAERFKQAQAQELCSAASKGSLAAVQLLLDRGCPPDACDYDKRTALMVAAGHGHCDVVALLVSARADPNRRDTLGSSALLEAVKGGWDDMVSQLVSAGATLQLSDSELSSALCSMVKEDQADLLRRYIAAGADVTAADYDKRTPLHIAAAEGKLGMVQLLVEEGGAELTAADRWGNTPLTEAKRVGAVDVVVYLSSAAAKQASAAARQAAADRSSKPHGRQPSS